MRQQTLAALAALALCAGANAAPSYLPFGAQGGVLLATVLDGGWTPCYAGAMSAPIGSSADKVLSACQGDWIIMAARETGSDTLLALAATLRSEALIDTGKTSNTHLSNGAQWYYAPSWSWGFTSAGDSVENTECDVSDDSPISICLHTHDVVGGFRINNILGLSFSDDYEKLFFVANAVTALPEPAGLALVGLAALGAVTGPRRRRMH